MNYQVVDWEQDIAGKFRFRVLIGDAVVMLKFQKFPTDEVVQEAAARQDVLMQQMAEEAARQEAVMRELLALAQERVDGATNAG